MARENCSEEQQAVYAARNAIRQRAKREAQRNVFIPPILNQERRDSCKYDLYLFCLTYLLKTFRKPFCLEHIRTLDELQDKLLYGGLKAIAAPRGWGKDSLLMAAVIWAIVYGHCKYIVYAGPNMKFACDRLDTIKRVFELDYQELYEDFPEICAPIRDLGGSTQRANTQRANGELTRLKWTTNHVRFPMVDGSAASGSIIEAAGINKGNRGFNLFSMRPDAFVINDIESKKESKSKVIQETFEGTIDQSFGGIAGPGEKLSGFILCTILEIGCLSEKYTDPTQKPAWNGSRLKSLIRPPTNTEMWDIYVELWREGKTTGLDPDARWAYAYYALNKEEMDEGALTIWEDRFNEKTGKDGFPYELSALQHIYNEIAEHGEIYFLTELQNDPPIPQNSATGSINARMVSERLSGYPHGIFPESADYLVQGIDIGGREIHFICKAIWADGSFAVVDYGRIQVNQITESSNEVHNKQALEREIMRTLRFRRAEMEAAPYKTSDGGEKTVDLTLIDSGWFPDVVYRFCAESGGRFRPTKGVGSIIGEHSQRYNPGVPGEFVRPGFHCEARFEKSRGCWLWRIDANFWKEWVQRRYLQATGTVGSGSLYGNEPRAHRGFSKHIVAERFVVEKNAFEKLSPHNHFLDASALCCAAGGMLGVRLKTDDIAEDAAPHQEGKNRHREIQNSRATRAPAPRSGMGSNRRIRRIS